MSVAEGSLPEPLLDEISKQFRALGEPLRLRLLRLMESGERSVNEMTAELKAGQSNVSRHLQALFEAGLVDRRRQGTVVYYRIADPMVFEMCRIVCDGTQRRMAEKLKRLGAGSGGAE